MENKIEIYKSSANEIELIVKLTEDTVWLNRQQLSILFARDIKTIGKHINNIFSDSELVKETVVAKIATTAADGNKRIAAACFLFFLQYNHFLINSTGKQIISNEALAALTLFVANSKAEESDVVKQLIISILNRSNSS